MMNQIVIFNLNNFSSSLWDTYKRYKINSICGFFFNFSHIKKKAGSNKFQLLIATGKTGVFS